MNEKPSRHRRAIVLVCAVVVGLLAVGAVTTAIVWHGSATVLPDAPVTVRTVKVSTTDLTDSQTLSGTLGFGVASTVAGAGEGTLTRLPAVGDVVGRGAVLYRVDDVAVPVFLGATPLFRTLGAVGLKGADVQVVADNLNALGFPTGIQTTDPARAVWTARATAALTRWQRSAGLDPSGTLGVGQVVVLGAEARVNAVLARLGDAVARDVLTVTSTAKVVTVPVKATELSPVKVGGAVTIVLPDDSRIPGTIAAIGTAAAGGDGKDSASDEPPTLAVTITPNDPAAVAALDYATVEVKVVTRSRPGVLAVPVGALVALSEGGYAVQRRDGRLIAVTTGMFSRSLVEISGPGVTDGMTVVTAQ